MEGSRREAAPAGGTCTRSRYKAADRDIGPLVDNNSRRWPNGLSTLLRCTPGGKRWRTGWSTGVPARVQCRRVRHDRRGSARVARRALRAATAGMGPAAVRRPSARCAPSRPPSHIVPGHRAHGSRYAPRCPGANPQTPPASNLSHHLLLAERSAGYAAELRQFAHPDDGGQPLAERRDALRACLATASSGWWRPRTSSSSAVRG